MPVKSLQKFFLKNPGTISQLPGRFYISESAGCSLRREAPPFSIVHRRKNDTTARRCRPFVRVLAPPRHVPLPSGARFPPSQLCHILSSCSDVKWDICTRNSVGFWRNTVIFREKGIIRALYGPGLLHLRNDALGPCRSPDHLDC